MSTPSAWLAHAGEAMTRTRKRFHPSLRRRDVASPLPRRRLVPVQAFECQDCGALTRFESHFCIRETR